MSEEATQIHTMDVVEAPPSVEDVNSRIEERLFPPIVIADMANSEVEKTDESEPVAKVDSNEIDDSQEIPQDSDESKDEPEEVEQEPEEETAPTPAESEETIFEALGIQENQVVYDEGTGAMLFTAKVGDETYNVSMSDLIKSYQLDKHVNQKSMKLSEQQKAFDEGHGEFKARFDEKLAEADNMSQILERELIGNYNQIDWEQLRATDATQYAVQRQTYAEQAQRLQSIKEAIEGEKKTAQEQQNEIMKRKFDEFLVEQDERLIQEFPSWLDPDTKKSEKEAIMKFAEKEYGFSPEELEHIYDNRIIRVLNDAKVFKNAKASLAEKTKGREVPKFQKPGSGSKMSKAAKEAKAKRAQLRKTGSARDLANVLIDRI